LWVILKAYVKIIRLNPWSLMIYLKIQSITISFHEFIFWY
jgi:hypothetical protein